MIKQKKQYTKKTLKRQLDKALWTTKGARFKSYHKYKSILNIVKFLNILLSFLLISIAICNISGVELIINEKYINIILLIISIYIFTSSIYFPLLEGKVKLIFTNATEISKLLIKLKLITSNKKLLRLSDQYSELEKELNHDEIDYKIWCNEQRSISNNYSCIYKLYIYLLWHFYSKFPIFIIFLVLLGFYYLK